jgi:hypothetical protein
MANIYYSHPSNRRGILRAVLSSQESRCLLRQHSVHYAGQQFPATDQNRRADFAVLRILEGEGSVDRRVGFYLFDEDIMQIEEVVQSCDTKVSLVGAKQRNR